ncbi:MAG: pyruvate ferredoxin oxidoreductase [Candidatus Berkelbacteria bacterium]|nr:pyruvate ferredoxin oxidoreductase [Candidatus Berkelbacteria bacterium]
MKRLALTGNEAMAYAMKQSKPDVFCGYPITPTTDILVTLAKYIANGELDCEFVTAESEHSVASILYGASSAGARCFTCTASQGLALMHEVLHIISGARLPIIIGSSSRSLSSPINVHGDHADFMDMRDTSFIQIFSENAQDSYDNFLQGVRIAEEARLPAIISSDGFITSHNLEAVEVLKDEIAYKFIGDYKTPFSILDIKNPITINPLSLPNSFMEIKKSQADAMRQAKKVIPKVALEYEKISGRQYGFFREYCLDDAKVAIVVLGSTAETAQLVIDELRNKGIKAGILALRVFRPFPAKEIMAALSNCKVVCILDRADAYSSLGGPLFVEVASALYKSKSRPILLSRIYGLGGREIDEEMIKNIFEEIIKINKGQKLNEFGYIGLKK